MQQVIDFFNKLFDTSDWPPRWHCGKWSEFNGWLYIVSDLLIWAAYFAIPIIIIKYISKKRDQRFIRLYFLFAGFIISCGTTHFLDAVAFWAPAYRLSALVRAITAVVSWITIYHLLKVLPHAFALKTSTEFEKEILRREQAEENLNKKNRQLKESREVLQNVFSHSSVGKALVSLDGDWLDVNPALCHMLGYTKEELLQMNFKQLTHPDDLALGQEYIKMMLRREIETYRLEKRYIKKDQTIVWGILSVSLVWNNDKPEFFIAQIADITENKKLIAELEEKNTTLQFNISQLNEFNRIISHNMRTPALALISISDFVEQSENAEDKVFLLSKIKQTSVSLLSTLNDLKQYMEIQLNSPRINHLSNIKKALQKSKENLADEIKNSGALISENLEIYEVVFPEIYLESVLYNLLSNAVKYRDAQKTPVIVVRSFSMGEYDCIEVTDNGIGIDMEKHANELFKYKKIFHKGYESNGLGLFITRSQVNSYGGDIQVSSGPGMGSSFRVRLKKYQSANEKTKAISA